MTTTEPVAAPPRHEYDRVPYLIAYQNNSGVRDVYGGVADLVVLESHLLRPKDRPSRHRAGVHASRSAAARTCR